MSLKDSHTTSDYIPWEDMNRLIDSLYLDGKYRMSLLIGCGCYFGLRISDLRKLKWEQLLNAEKFAIHEHKTGKYRSVRINPAIQEHIKRCHAAMGKPNVHHFCFLNRFGGVISVQMINRDLKAIRDRYSIPVENISSHSFRKTFGRRVVANAGKDSEMALPKLCELFNHTSPAVTRRYLGLRAEELERVYEEL